MYRIKFYGMLYSIAFALMLSGCSLSGMSAGSKSAAEGYGITTEAANETGGGSSEYLSDQENVTETDVTVQPDEKTKKAVNAGNSRTGKKRSGQQKNADSKADYRAVLADIPAYSGAAYCEINGNVPGFGEDELVAEAFENYSDLDFLGRCGVAYANICKELMPTEERSESGMVKPSGWHTVKYSDRIDGNYLYNRCHLIGYQLAGENANEKNLITGTRYLNVTGMLPFENEVADYVESTDNHVLYRVTPIFDGDDLVASGVQMEAESVEDKGAGVCFNVYVYNVQPGVIIDYATGDSEADPDYVVSDSGDDTYGSSKVSDDGEDAGPDISDGVEGDKNSGADAAENVEDTAQAADQGDAAESTYIVNTNTGKFHRPDCSSVKRMKESNKAERTTTRDELISEGYEPCKNCNP